MKNYLIMSTIGMMSDAEQFGWRDKEHDPKWFKKYSSHKLKVKRNKNKRKK